MNIYHKSLYTWSFQKAVSCVKIDNFHEQTYETLNENLAFPSVESQSIIVHYSPLRSIILCTDPL